MAEIVSLVERLEIAEEPDAGVIAALESVLERAKTGEVQGVRIVVCNGDGTTAGTYCGIGSYAMLGMMYMLTNCLAEELDCAEEIYGEGA